MSTEPDHDTEAEQEAESRRDAGAPSPAEAELVRSVSPVLMARRLIEAEHKLAKARAYCAEAVRGGNIEHRALLPGVLLAIIGSEEEP